MKLGIDQGVGVVEFTVTPEQTAQLEENVHHPVYSTFWLAHHAEIAARRAIQPFLEDQEDAVGARLEVHHLAMAAIGAHVMVRARVVEVDGPRVRCSISATAVQTKTLLAEGSQDQVVLSKESLKMLINNAVG